MSKELVATKEYLTKAKNIEAELYTTERLINDLEYKIAGLGISGKDGICKPEPAHVRNPFEDVSWLLWILFLPLLATTGSWLITIGVMIALFLLGNYLGESSKSRGEGKLNEMNMQRYIHDCERDDRRVYEENKYKEQLQSELKITREIYDSLRKARQKLYSQNTIHPKYQSLIPVFSFYEYYDTGRCTCLQGPLGAYSVYEMESKLNKIISNQDIILKELHALRNEQYALYEAVMEGNNTLDQINSENIYIREQLNSVQENTALTAYHTRCTAIATSVMAYNMYTRHR